MWKASEQEINSIIALAGEPITTSATDHYTALAPYLYDIACDYVNQQLDMDNDKQRSAVFLFVARAGQFYKTKAGLLGRSMGTVSYSYAEDIPKSVFLPLKPYRKLRGWRHV